MLSISITTILYYFIPIAATVFAVLYINNHFLSSSSNTSPTHPQSSSSSTTRRQPEPPSTDRIFTLAELRKYDGSDPTSAILLGCKGLVFDMTPGESFYGPGGPYSGFAGHDASRSLARMELDYASADIRDLKPAELQVLDEWYDKYQMKYQVVGKILDHSEPNSGIPPSNGWKQPTPTQSLPAPQPHSSAAPSS